LLFWLYKSGGDLVSDIIQVLGSPQLCLDVHLGSIETLKAPAIKISQAENIYGLKLKGGGHTEWSL